MALTYIHLANLLTCGNKSVKEHWLSELRAGRGTTLETFWKTREVDKLLAENPDIKIFLDSGAHSLLNAMAGLISTGTTVKTEKIDGDIVFTPEEFDSRLSANQKVFFSNKAKSMVQDFVDYSFTDNEDVHKYIDLYIAYIHKYKDQLTGYVNLDIIYNAEKSWEIQQAIESNGLRPIPVFHYGEDYKWMRKYVEEYDYIGVGGVATGLGIQEFVGFADKCFDIIAEIKPGIKVHGFAVTSFALMTRWSWYSVDSTSWLKHAAYGNVLVPRYSRTKDAFDFAKSPFTITVSDMALWKPSKSNVHYMRKYSPPEIERINRWIGMTGAKLEVVETDGGKYPCLTSLLERQKVNVYYYNKLLEKAETLEHRQHKSQQSFF